MFKSCLLEETMLCINFTMELWLAPKYVKKNPARGWTHCFPRLGKSPERETVSQCMGGLWWGALTLTATKTFTGDQTTLRFDKNQFYTGWFCYLHPPLPPPMFCLKPDVNAIQMRARPKQLLSNVKRDQSWNWPKVSYATNASRGCFYICFLSPPVSGFR